MIVVVNFCEYCYICKHLQLAGCSIKYTKGSIFFCRFPKNPGRQAKWIKAVGRGENWEANEQIKLAVQLLLGKKAMISQLYIISIQSHQQQICTAGIKEASEIQQDKGMSIRIWLPFSAWKQFFCQECKKT